MSIDEMVKLVNIMTERIHFLEYQINNAATKDYVNARISDTEYRIDCSKEHINIELIISETEKRFRNIMKEKYEQIKSDRCSLGMTSEEFECELERLLFES